MKLIQKSANMINQKQFFVFKVALLQLLLGFLMLFILSRCSNRENQPSAPGQSAAASATDTSQKKVNLVNDDYVPIASYYSEEIRNKLKDLEKAKFEDGTLGDQVLDYLKKGDNDFGDEFKFIDLRFEKRNAEINDKFAHEIQDLATIMTNFPNLTIKFMSYTDNVGNEKANEVLSENRALEVRKRLVKAGIDEKRITIKAYGGKFPVGDNKTYDGQLINNRIEMMILSK